MENIINKIKNFKQPKYICYLYFFIPIFVCALSRMNKENDIWFLLNHGKYILNYGFPHIEPFTIHQDLYFVMQQWLSATIFYTSYKLLGQYGLMLVVSTTNILILFFLYKLCMLLSDNRFRLSIIISSITDILLAIFIIPRPWIFTILNLIITLYIMELFYKNNNKKVLVILPFISILQINIQSSMWFLLYLFILPYFVILMLDKIKKNNNKIFSLILILVVMFVVGFINPYGIDNILYVFNSYGNYYINRMVVEMQPISLNKDINNSIYIYSYLFYLILMIEILIYIFCKKGKFEIRHLLLFLGVTFLGLKNIRNFWIFIIGTIPFLISYLKPYFNKSIDKENIKMNKKEKINYIIIIILLIIYTTVVAFINNKDFSNELEKGIDRIYEEKNINQNTKVYANYNNGSYVEYRNLKSYIDTRAEIFIKKVNHKEEIIKEYYNLCNKNLSYNKFINKYKFDYMIVMKNETIYNSVLKDKEYKTIYSTKKYKIFKRIV